jgi:hypothetical protein
MDQRVGVPMHLPPLRSVTAKDPGDPQRPVLARQSTNFATAKEALNRLFGSQHGGRQTAAAQPMTELASMRNLEGTYAKLTDDIGNTAGKGDVTLPATDGGDANPNRLPNFSVR